MSSANSTDPANVYLYGMIVYSTIHRLAAEFPDADGYGEIEETHIVPGGETGNSAIVLARWGHHVKVAGPFLGQQTREGILGFLGTRGIDCSGLVFDPTFDGVRDMVLVGGKARAVFGRFGHYFNGPKKWAGPERLDIAAADIVGIDPFFGEESAEVGRLCRELGRPYVTIDCAPDSALNRGAAAIVVSGEYLRGSFPGRDRQELVHSYASESAGLVIATNGAEGILYARGKGPVRSMGAFKIVPKSTLGAGDTFRGGVIHGVLSGLSDEGIVRFAAATAACVCRRFPMALDPPGLEEIASLEMTGDR
jgi:sugar/nucleoside kinase (ribokinase family)